MTVIGGAGVLKSDWEECARLAQERQTTSTPSSGSASLATELELSSRDADRDDAQDS